MASAAVADLHPVVISTAAAAPVPVAFSSSPATPVSVPPEVTASTAPTTSPFFYIVHPAEDSKLPSLSQVFVYGAAPKGSTVSLNGAALPLSRTGGFLTMVPVRSGDVLLTAEARTPAGEHWIVNRLFTIAPGFTVDPSTPAVLEGGSISPAEDLWLAPHDALRVTFQGSPGGTAEFSINGVAAHVPMVELGTPLARGSTTFSMAPGRGVYEGTYMLQPEDHGNQATIEVTLKKDRATLKQKAAGHLTIDSGSLPRIGLVTDDTVAVRTGPEGGYDLFVYRGMRVRLTGKMGGQWRVRLSSTQTGWVKQSAIQELPPGAQPVQSLLTNITIVHALENALIKVPLGEVLPYRTEQTLSPPQLLVTLYGAVDKTDLIKYDPSDTLIRQVRWRQLSPDTCQLVIDPTFARWWGYDVRYEGNTLVIEIRKPWIAKTLKDMVIAVDPGHGGFDNGAIGVHQTLEKEANLEIARVVKSMLEKAGARPFLTRDKDVDVPLYDRARIAWNRKARIFVSVHCNASGEGENPIWNNGFSTYWYQPQSQELATLIHEQYQHTLGLPDHGLNFADLAVCRMTQMPAVLTEQAFIIVPDQEEKIFSVPFQRSVATAILSGLKRFVAKP